MSVKSDKVVKFILLALVLIPVVIFSGVIIPVLVISACIEILLFIRELRRRIIKAIKENYKKSKETPK